MDNIILIGMPGSGKSTVGAVLAQRLGKQFLDTDNVIMEHASSPLQPLVDQLGTQGFLELEADAVCTVSCSHTIIATGGSVPCLARGMDYLKTLGTVVYLSIPFDELQARLSNISDRGIAMAPGQTLKDVYDYRVTLYEMYQDVTVEVGGQTVEETVEAVLNKIQPNPS